MWWGHLLSFYNRFVYKADIRVFEKKILSIMSEVLVEVTMWMVMYLLGSRTMQNLPEYPLGNKVYIYIYVRMPGNTFPCSSKFEKFWLWQFSVLQGFLEPLITNIHVTSQGVNIKYCFHRLFFLMELIFVEHILGKLDVIVKLMVMNDLESELEGERIHWMQ